MSLSQRSRALESSKFAEKRRKKLIGRIVIFILIVAVILGLAVLVLRIPFIQISTIEVVGADPAIVDQVNEVTKQNLLDSYLKVIPKSNIIFYPEDEIRKDLVSNFKNIKSISIKRGGLSSLKITIHDREKAIIVCDGFRGEIENVDQKCFFADKSGYVFSKLASSTAVSSDNYMRYYVFGDKGGKIVGTSFMDTLKFAEVNKFVEGSIKSGIVPLGVLINENNQYEMYVESGIKRDTNSTSTISEITVYFDDKIPLEITLSNFVAFWNETFLSPKASTTLNFNYINLRYGNTIFYSTK